MKKILALALSGLLLLASLTGCDGSFFDQGGKDPDSSIQQPGDETPDDQQPDDQKPDDQKPDDQKPDDTPKTWDHQKSGQIITRPALIDGLKKEYLKDLNFSTGLGVTLFHANSSAGRISGILDFGGDAAVKSTPEDRHYVWDIAQWGCTHDLVSEGEYTREGSVISYRDPGKYLSFDVEKTGHITLGIKGSEEYPRDEEGNIRDRLSSAENWPHILLGANVGQTISSEAKHLYMEINYKVTKCESLVDRSKYPLDPTMHAAQFQWFITLSDRDPNSESFGATMWFGFSMFDTRAEGRTPGGMSAYDGGKEDNTGLFIYMFALDAAKKTSDRQGRGDVITIPSAVIGQENTVKVDILPWIEYGLQVARLQGAMKGASLKNLYVGSTNIGWELPGNYDAEVQIDYFNMYETYE